MSPRKFLFLQGVATPFFKELGQAILQNGHEVFRVNFCGGDSFFAGRGVNWRFSRPLSELPDWLKTKYDAHHFTDAVLFGDTRPVHTQAIALLRQQGVRIHVFEEGYLRPDWITLEQDGVNGYSRLNTEKAHLWQQANHNPHSHIAAIPTGASFAARAWHDIRYRIASGLLQPLYRHYKTHRPFPAYREYLGWVQRFPANKLWRERQDKAQIQRLVTQKTPYYLLPLQLDSDAQIRVHSPFESMQQVIREVMTSFAQHAPRQSRLVIKNHPLDTGLLQHQHAVAETAEALGIGERVIFLETGHLPTLLDHTKGTVLVNSTTGTSALFHRSPTIALGTAIFDLPGLTFQHGLDRFWKEATPPNPGLYKRFSQMVIALTQINGSFYTRRGRKLAIEGSLKAMQAHPVPARKTTQAAPQTEVLLPSPVYGGKMPESTYLYKKR